MPRPGSMPALFSCFLLLTACASRTPQPTSATGTAPTWKAPLSAALRLDDVSAVQRVFGEHQLSAHSVLNANQVRPLMLAAAFGSRDVVDWLLTEGAEVDAVTTLKDPGAYPETGGCSALFMACSQDQVDVARKLLERGANPNRQDDRGSSPLLLACALGRSRCAKLLIEHGADLDLEDQHGFVALERAIQAGHLEIATWLVQHGADVRTRDGRGALEMAAEKGDPEFLRLLIGKGAANNVTNVTAALMEAATEGNTEAARLLLAQGALFDWQTEEGWTPLMKAAAQGHAETAKLLCETGADPTLRNRFGRTALDYARGIPGTQGLKTIEEITEATDRKVFDQEELFYVLARRAEGTEAGFQRIVQLLEDYQKRYRAGTPAH